MALCEGDVLSINFVGDSVLLSGCQMHDREKVLGDGKAEGRHVGESYVGRLSLSEKMWNPIGCRAMCKSCAPLNEDRCGCEVLGARGG